MPLPYNFPEQFGDAPADPVLEAQIRQLMGTPEGAALFAPPDASQIGDASPDPWRDAAIQEILRSPEGRSLLTPTAAPVAPTAPTAGAPAPATARQPNPFASALGAEDEILKALLGASEAPRRQSKMDPWDLLMHLGPALMQAGSRPGASTLGAIGEGLGVGMKAAQQSRRDAMTQEKEDRLYNLQRAKLGVDIRQAMSKTTKAPETVKGFDSNGREQVYAYNAASGLYDRPVGGPKAAGDGKLPDGFRLADPSDPSKGVELIPGFAEGKGRLATPQRLPEGYQPIDPADPSKGLRLIPGFLDGKRDVATALTKPPEGFSFIDPANPAQGVRPLPGYAEGRAAQDALKPFTLPENATRVAPAASNYARNTAGFENPTGNPAARNPNSTATGDGQFLDGTWREMWPKIAQQAAPILSKRGIDPGRLTPEQVMGLRADPEISALAIDAYAKENTPILRQALGRTPDLGELQTAHMFGGAGAAQIITAPPQTPIQQLVSPKAYADNEKFLAGKTAGDVVNHFRQRQGRGQGIAQAPAPAAARSQAGREASVAPGYQVVAQGAKVPRVDNAYDAARGKDLAAARQLVSDEADSARDVLASVQNIRGLLDLAGDTSKLTPLTTELKAYAKAAGFNLEAAGIKDNVGVMQAASAEIKKLILPFFQSTKGAITERENRLFAEMTARPENDPEANRIILEIVANVARRKTRLDEMAIEYEEQHNGRLDAGWRRVVNDFYRKEGITGEGMVPGAPIPGLPNLSGRPASTTGPGPAPKPRGLAQPAPTSPSGAATASPGASKSIAPQIKIMDLGTLKQLVPEALSPEDRKAAADRWEELNRGAR